MSFSVFAFYGPAGTRAWLWRELGPAVPRHPAGGRDKAGTEPCRGLRHARAAWLGETSPQPTATNEILACAKRIGVGTRLCKHFPALAYSAGVLDAGAMSRSATALLIGLVGFAGYVVLVLLLADFVLRTHWTIQLLYFALAGCIWAWPAKWLIYWSAGKQR